MHHQLRIYPASIHDQAQVRRLLDTSRRSFAAFGSEDLAQLLASGACTVALDGDGMAAFLCVSLNQARWAFLRGVVIRDGWRSDEGLGAVLKPAVDRLRAEGATHLAAYGTALWLPPVLQRAGFQRQDWIVSLERHPRPLPDLAVGEVTLRAVQPGDLGRLAALDTAAFEPPYQMASGELIELMVTSGRFVVAERAGDGSPAALLGYACADVLVDTGQIIRLAVHPGAQRQGIGRALLNDGLAYCSAADARRVTINTQESNAASLHLYEQVGFRRIGRRVPLLVRSLWS